MVDWWPMPWCDDCSKYWSPNSLPPDGNCPNCGTAVADPTEEQDIKAPWHFKVLVVAAVIYLVWRAVQMIRWIL